MRQHIIYGPGGFDPTRPDRNIVHVEQLPDDDDELDAGALALARVEQLAGELAKATTLAQVRTAGEQLVTRTALVAGEQLDAARL